MLTNREAESGLDSGFEVEKELYYSTFDLQDKKEGITAFLEKRKARWAHCLLMLWEYGMLSEVCGVSASCSKVPFASLTFDL